MVAMMSSSCSTTTANNDDDDDDDDDQDRDETPPLDNDSDTNIGSSDSTASASAASADTTATAAGTAKAPFSALPEHIAFCCDGNGRWAAGRNLPAAAGHKAGADRLADVLEAIRDITAAAARDGGGGGGGNGGNATATAAIRHVTFFGFSTENWKRSETEVSDLFAVMTAAADRFRRHPAVLAGNVSVRVLGNLRDDRVPAALRSALDQLQRQCQTAKQQQQQEQQQQGQQKSRPARPSLTVHLAINYGGRQDIVSAARRLCQKAQVDPTFDPAGITEAAFAQQMQACGGGSDGGGGGRSSNNTAATATAIPDPDLLIRTAGEYRLSNFLLWNAAYAELYFTDTCWPDFDGDALREALRWYERRRRRFGG